MRLLLVVAVLVVAAPTVADAAAVKFCMQAFVDYDDSYNLISGETEDYWPGAPPPGSGGHYRARGMRVRVLNGSTEVYDAYLGDGLGAGDPGLGCTPTIYGVGTFTITMFPATYGFVNYNYVRAYHDEGPETMAVTVQNIYFNGTYVINVDPATVSATREEAWHAWMAGSFAIWRHNGGMTGKQYQILLDEDYDEARFEDEPPAHVELPPDQYQRKFRIVHEMGHHLAHHLNSDLTDYDCTFVANECPAAADLHSMGSREYEDCAAMEGFAHFYAADVWNDHGDDNCVFKYWKNGNPTVDCDGQDATYPTPFMERECSAASGFGVEVDWMRAFWDVHTDGSTVLDFNTMTYWLSTSPISSGIDYEDFDERADELASTYPTLNSRWDAAKEARGIDY